MIKATYVFLNYGNFCIGNFLIKNKYLEIKKKVNEFKNNIALLKVGFLNRKESHNSFSFLTDL